MKARTFNKRNLVLIIVSAVFLVVALALFLIGFIIKDGNILWWFTSKWAYWVYLILGLWALAIAGIFIGDKIKSL